MLDTDDTKVDPPKIITGAVYEAERLGQGVEQMVCISRLVQQNGKVFGLFRRFGLTFERFEESGEEMASWKLIWAPGQEKEALPKKQVRTAKKTSTKKIAEAK